ncbi:MAG TPA: hypothetical protein VNN08_24985 [Thermoanaerobaculia bacterium]|nr:hypothetical protein [Thermoanaerobaculia bacterium]
MSRVRPVLVLFLALLFAACAHASGTLFGLRNPGDGGRQVVIVDPVTGVVTPVSASISPPLPSASGVNALDAGGHRFFFIATPSSETDSRLFTVDTQTGALLSSPTIAGSAAAPFQSLDYDAGEAALYGLRNPGDAGRQVVRIDVATAAVTPVSVSIAPPNAAPSGVSALDAPGNRFFFVGTPSPDPNQHIYTVNTATGAIISSPVVSAGVGVLGMVYDEAESKLFIWQNPGDGGRQIALLDPATGAVTPVSASIAPPLGSSSGVLALDAAGNRIFFAGVPAAETDSRLYTVDTNTGAVISNPTVVGSAIQFFSGLEFAPPAPPPVITVVIDIKPGSFPNSVNVGSSGVIPVAIMTTPSFDATTVDASTVRFGPGNAVEAHGRGHLEDVDGDGHLDMVLHFRTDASAIPCGATSATLTGQTTGGQAITGTDSVRTICR